MEPVESQLHLSRSRSGETEINETSFHPSSSTCAVCHCNLGQQTREPVSSACTKTTLEDLIAPCLKHDNFAAPSPALPFYASLSCSPPPLPTLFSSDNPCFPIMLSHPYLNLLLSPTPSFHSALFVPSLLHLLSEVLETSHWLL